MSTTTYRCRCEHCGEIFFAADRDAGVCAKCARRYGIKLPTPPRQQAPGHRPGRAVPIPPRRPVGTPAPPPSPPRGPAQPPAEQQPRPPQQPAPRQPQPQRGRGQSAPKPARRSELTDELRQEILAAAERLAASMPARQRHVKLAEKLNVQRKLVAQVLLERQRQEEREITLPEERQREIHAAYERLVMGNERPPDGRHRTLARDYELTQAQLRLVLRPFLAALPSPHELSREQRFAIEKGYLARLEAGAAHADAISQLADELGSHPWQVGRYVDMIHEDPRRLQNVPPCTEEQAQAIRDAYREYLAGSGPTEGPLHSVIGEKVGVEPRQVHKVLLAYRYELRHVAR